MNSLPPVYIFSSGERTCDFCVYSYEQLGFKDITVIEGDDSFESKYLRFAKSANALDSDFFIRTDADLIAFDGVLKIVYHVLDASNPCWIEGQRFDCLINNFLPGTPQFIPKKVVNLLLNDPSLMSRTKKPESSFWNHLRQNNIVQCVNLNILTSFHDYDQYPSKICNTFITRIARGDRHRYNDAHLKSIGYYWIMEAAEDYLKKNIKTTMDYMDFSYLDDGVMALDKEDFPNLYQKYNNLYTGIL